MPCDICGNSTTGTTISSKAMRRAVEMGFSPFTEGLIPATLTHLITADSAKEWKRQTMNGLLSHRDWKLCDNCRDSMSPILTPDS